MKRILTALILLLVAGVAYAANGGGDIGLAKSFGSGLTPSSTDFSVAYLSQIFGTVGNVLQGTSGQILGKMFSIFNKGVLVVAALWLCMTTVQVALRAATEGSFMGQNKSVHMIFLRIALGFGLIIPSSATGYSMLQDVFMKIVVAGVALADQTWSAALNYMQYGGNLYIPPSNLKTDTDLISKMIGTTPVTPPSAADPAAAMQQLTKPLEPVTQIFQDEVCMIKSSTKAWAPITAKSNYAASFSPGYDYTTGQINFPGAGDPISSVASKGCGTATSYFCDKNASLCVANATRDGVQSAEFDYSYSALKQLVTALLPVATSYVQKQDEQAASTSSTSSSETSDRTFAKGIMVGILGYANLITPYQNLLSQNNAKSNADLLSTAEKQGWIMAGAFYWNIEQSNNTSASVALSKLLPTVTTPTPSVFLIKPPESVTYLVNAANQVITVYSTYIAGLWQDYVGAQQSNVTSSASATQSGSSGNAMLDRITSSAMSQFSSGSGSLSIATGNYNPIVALMNEGKKLLKIVVGIWIGAIALTTGLAIAAGFCTSTSPGGLIFNTALSWVKSIMMIITGALLVPGAILAYYVPMYPFAVFTFAAIGWFGMVLEGMAAAPLVCLGMTHPEGHDFLGKAEQALMLFLSIFLRPALMVIGIIAFMVVSFVAFAMFLSAFTVLLDGLNASNTGFINEGLVGLITQIMVLVIFGFMTMEIVEQCAKLIYQLPNNINKWIGAPGMGEEYGQMAGAIKGGVSSAAEQTGKGAQAALETGEMLGKAPGQIKQLAEQLKEDDGTGSATPTPPAGGGGTPPPVV